MGCAAPNTCSSTKCSLPIDISRHEIVSEICLLTFVIIFWSHLSTYFDICILPEHSDQEGGEV